MLRLPSCFSCVLIATLGLASAVHAACPVPDPAAQEKISTPLFQKLKASKSRAEAAAAASAIWDVWIVAPDAKAQELFDRLCR